MKKQRLIKLIIVMLIVAISATVGIFYYKDRDSLKNINISKVKSVSLYPFIVTTQRRVYNYNTKNIDDMKVINNIVNYLKSGKYVGTQESLVISLGGTYPTLALELTNGQTIEVQMEGAEKDQVFIEQSDKHKIYKFYSPELRRLFTDELQLRFNS